MMDLKCPKCGTMFSVDEAEYNTILSQVKNQEFEAEVARREAELREQMQAQIRADKAEASTKVSELKQEIQAKERIMRAEIDAAIAKKDTEIANLRKAANDAIVKEQQKVSRQVADLEAQVKHLNDKNQLLSKDAELHLKEQKDSYEMQLRLKEEQLQQYKDFRSQLNSKMLGETLEQHCWNSYEQYVRPYLPGAYFEKDNDSKDHTKGDFIFREEQDGVEVVSIMFEMKNESEQTERKHKNEDFFKKLDEDRRKKNCVNAVLVSTLEADNVRYNDGIVTVPQYPNMYVIRPQFFLSILSILRQAGLSSVETKKQLEIARQQTVDVTDFEKKVSDFGLLFGKHCSNAAKQRVDAEKHLRGIIDLCTKALEALRLEGVHYDNAEKSFQERFTVRALTAGNPTMSTMFEEARQNSRLSE